MNDEPISRKEMNKLHAMIRDLARQTTWDGDRLSEKEWKFRIFAGVYGQDFVRNVFHDSSNPASRPFIIGNTKRTRSLTVSGGAELITQLYAFGNERGVNWTDPKDRADREAWEEETRRAA